MWTSTAHVTEWDETDGQGSPAVFAHGIFTWGTDPEYGFAAQRPLARTHRLLLLDRRGYGLSPDIPPGRRSDFDADADDLVEVMQQAAAQAPRAAAGRVHLVGHANGGLAAMLAAARRPDLVRSLTLIQPSAFRAAAGHPAVDRMLARVETAAATPPDLTPHQFLHASTEGIGLPVPEPTPDRLRAVATSMHERPVWEADPPLEPLATAPFPTLVVCGTWEDAPELYRSYVGEPIMAACASLAETLGADLLRVPGYYPHTQQPDAVNAALRKLWE